MGYMTKQWLEGRPQRDRDYSPVEVDIYGSPSRGDWSERNDVFFRIEVFRDDGNYQVVFFTQDEVGKIFSKMVKVAEQSTRINVALAILTRLPDAELLQFMTKLLSEREKGGERDDGDWLE
jgi:hypothetical protein